MAITNFIPEVWAASLLSNLQKNLVYGGLANRDYEGEISEFGDTVHITSLADPTIGESRHGERRDARCDDEHGRRPRREESIVRTASGRCFRRRARPARAVLSLGRRSLPPCITCLSSLRLPPLFWPGEQNASATGSR